MMINENLAREAKRANSFKKYVEGSATEEYEYSINEFKQLTEKQKSKVDKMYHGKIDKLYFQYKKDLADNINSFNRITASCPSILIAGGSSFSSSKKEKQNERLDRNYEEYNKIKNYEEILEGIGTVGISSDNKNIIQLLEEKISLLEEKQKTMKEVNKYFKKNNTLKGCELLGSDELEEANNTLRMRHSQPFPSFQLTNNSSKIRSSKKRLLLEIEKQNTTYIDFEFIGGEVKHDKEENRIKILFDEIPNGNIRNVLKSFGFRWSGKNSAWQRMLNSNGIYNTNKVLKKLEIMVA